MLVALNILWSHLDEKKLLYYVCQFEVKKQYNIMY